MVTSRLTFPDRPQWRTTVVGLLCTSDQLVAETSTWQHKPFTTDNPPHYRRDSNPQSQQASGRRPTSYTALRLGSAVITLTSKWKHMTNLYWLLVVLWWLCHLSAFFGNWEAPIYNPRSSRHPCMDWCIWEQQCYTFTCQLDKTWKLNQKVMESVFWNPPHTVTLIKLLHIALVTKIVCDVWYWY